MAHSWLAHYPDGVPDEVDTDEYRSLVHLMEKSFAEFAKLDAYVGIGKKTTYAQLDLASRRVAAWLLNKGLQKGDRVAVMMPNIVQSPIVTAGILRAGLAVVHINPLYTARELEHQLADSGAKAIFVLEHFARTVQQVLANTVIEHVVLASIGDPLSTVKKTLVNVIVRKVKKMVPTYQIPTAVPYSRVLAQGAKLPFDPPDLGPEDIAFLQYTGGTTGPSKGAILLHSNVVAAVLQFDVWSSPIAREKLGDGVQAVNVCALPLYHIYALTLCFLVGIRQGALNILIPNPRDLDALAKEIAPYRITHFPAVNTLFNALVRCEAFRKIDLSRLIVSPGGGAAIQQAVDREWQQLTGCPITEGYGLSETSATLTSNPVMRDEFSGTVGLPLPSTDVIIIDDDGKQLACDTAGEVCVKGPQVMAGYWNLPTETARCMTTDGYFKTGDIGVMDERGYLRIVDRKKDMILVSGFNVYPNEIEAVLQAHPKVFECAVIGVPDDKSGEAIRAFVVRGEQNVQADELFAYCRENLTAYKCPRDITFRGELPKSTVGKILRRELRGS